jgi:catechol 2,3-dioxygenase-like lactoylglutathione lyase family enzyme
MEWKLELVPIPVSDVDRAKAFYTQKARLEEDLDHKASEGFRVVRLTPPGSACSIAIGTGIVDTPPGSVQGLHLLVPDIDVAREQSSRGGRRGQRSPALRRPRVETGHGRRLELARLFRRSGRQRPGLAAVARSWVGYRKEDEYG